MLVTAKATDKAGGTASASASATVSSTGVTGVPRFVTNAVTAGQKFIGCSTDTTITPAQVGTMLGTKVGLVREYFQSDQIAAAVSFCNGLKANGQLPVISFKVPNGDWAGVAAGNYRSWVLDVRDKLRALAWPMVVSFHHEPNSDGPAADFRAMYDNELNPQFAPASDLLCVAPILNGFNFIKVNPDAYDWAPRTCKVILYDNYNQWWTDETNITKNFTGASETWRKWSPASQHADILDTIMSWPGVVACGIAEWGVHYEWTTPGKAAGWISDFTALVNARPACFLLSAFQSAANSPRGGWRFDQYTTTAQKQADGTPIANYQPNTERVNAAQPLYAKTIYPS